MYADLRGLRGATGVHQSTFTSLHSKINMLRCSTGPEVESDSTVVWPRLGSLLSYGTDPFQSGSVVKW